MLLCHQGQVFLGNVFHRPHPRPGILAGESLTNQHQCPDPGEALMYLSPPHTGTHFFLPTSTYIKGSISTPSATGQCQGQCDGQGHS